MPDLPQFDVEHAINMYADGFVLVPAFAIYEKEAMEAYASIISRSHIYMIGFMPDVEVIDVEERDGNAVFHIKLAGDAIDWNFPLPEGGKIVSENHRIFVELASGERKTPSFQSFLQQNVTFDVQYIGQSIGRSGERTALDRLLKHETLQKISVQGPPQGYKLYVLMMELIDANRNLVVFKPEAIDMTSSSERISAGIDKLFSTTKKERVSLFEAAFIRYFEPKYNKTFKDSFPSTDSKVLSDCFDKDFAAVAAEIYIESMPIMLKSDSKKAAPFHVAFFNLYTDNERRHFLSGL